MQTTLDYLETRRAPATEDATALVDYAPKDVLFFQGDRDDHVLHLQSGEVMLSMTTASGKEAVIGRQGSGAFLGEEILTGARGRRATATALTPCTVRLWPRHQVWQSLQRDDEFRLQFVSSLMSRVLHLEHDLVDQMVHSARQRLARQLLLLADSGDTDDDLCVLPPLSQEVLACMVGTTRARVNHFMNEFRTQGLLTYDHRGITINRARLGRVPTPAIRPRN